MSQKGVEYTQRRKFGIDQKVLPLEEGEGERQKRAENRLQGAEDGLSAQEAKRRRRLDRDPLHQGLIEERKLLINRDYDLDLQSKVGKSQIITAVTPLNQQAGFYCSVCDCILRDSQSYLDHINGKWHNRALGMSMKTERVSVDKVKKRLEHHRRKRNENGTEDYLPDGFNTIKEDEENRKERKRLKKDSKYSDGDQNEKEDNKDQEKDDLDDQGEDEMLASIGFGNFGGSVKK
eukprot:TRINITY_DN2677_c1_g1_i2.p1 TRINITY_DN2677_c1_g1~~TRINITY_DN2677_c1_g1_i2.p1  ORF type:complete len:259 (-),score=32.58 TRINITY_DN2677_c1_g1_i2:718-1419(-)